jgi:4,5-DOPA dioxygenase extradiol
MTEGTWVTHMKNPRTIHDFFGFPDELFKVQYPAPGSPEIAELIQAAVVDPEIQTDDELWGLDHGTWAVLRHLFPEANVPVLQLSLNIAQPFSYHFDLGCKLKPLRDKGVLIVGSGNIVHNLRNIKWEDSAEPYDWAVEFDEWVKGRLLKGDHQALTNDVLTSKSGKLSIPTTEHYLPLLYTLGATGNEEPVRFEYEGVENGSISMRSLSYGL